MAGKHLCYPFSEKERLHPVNARAPGKTLAVNRLHSPGKELAEKPVEERITLDHVQKARFGLSKTGSLFHGLHISRGRFPVQQGHFTEAVALAQEAEQGFTSSFMEVYLDETRAQDKEVRSAPSLLDDEGTPGEFSPFHTESKLFQLLAREQIKRNHIFQEVELGKRLLGL